MRSKPNLFSLSLMLGIYLLPPTFPVLARDSQAAQTDPAVELSPPPHRRKLNNKRPNK
jgi:hypothetical protein